MTTTPTPEPSDASSPDADGWTGDPRWTAARVRETFLDFFASKHGHTRVPSSPVVPHDDPTLMFANAGMNQFKPVFLGHVPPGSPLEGLTRAANTQKCIRAGGKHNDLEDVGKDTYHHTFFEMLGNWSFGDYFKAEAIEWAWDLLTRVYGLPADRLYATYFGGEEASGQPADDEAKQLWLKHLPPERVLPGNAKDNFWEMGDTGPCGPCSEIHFDRVGGRNAAGLVNRDDPDVLEVWNLVFIQFDRQPDGSLRPLPAKHVDTGMGLERLVSVLQNKRSNYDTDVFNPYFVAIEQATGARPYRGKLGAEDADGVDTAYRVIADHIRTLTLAITDGATPSNEGRGYVLRRVLRRAVRFGRQKLNAKTGFFSRLVPIVVESLGDAFPELRKDPARVQGIILDEEESFGRTLDRGIKLFQEAATIAGRNAMNASAAEPGGDDGSAADYVVDYLTRHGLLRDGYQTYGPEMVDWSGYRGPFRPVISGADAFQLYDTYGFPLDLTQLMAEERGLTVDVAGFEKEMEAQRERSRAGAKDGAKRLELTTEAVDLLKAKLKVQPTDDSHKFDGADRAATIKAIWDGRTFDDHTDPNETGLGRVGIVLDKTNFYSEMGGQVADHGRIADRAHKAEFRVDDVRSFGGYVLHIGRLAKGQFRVGETVQLHLDQTRRKHIRANHTATHLMNFGLRRVLGEGADQKGSLVAPDRLRFDFDASKPVSPAQLGEVEAIVREFIEADERVYAEGAPLFVAKQISGLRAVFGEVYPDPVRVVSVGAPITALTDAPEDPDWAKTSIEFCGGTHVERTGEIRAFAITQEEAVAKGIRRVVAVTGAEAEAAIRAAAGVRDRIEAAGRLPAGELSAEAAAIAGELDALTLPAPEKAALRAALTGLQEKVKAAEKAAAGERRAAAEARARQIAHEEQGSADAIIVRDIACGSDRGALQAALKVIQTACPSAAVMLLSPDPDAGSVAVIACVPKTLIVHGLKAGDWVRETAQVMGGKGGGKPEQAQGGGSDVTQLGKAIDTARRFGLRAIS